MLPLRPLRLAFFVASLILSLALSCAGLHTTGWLHILCVAASMPFLAVTFHGAWSMVLRRPWMLAILLVGLSGCVVPEDKVGEVLAKQGFRDIQPGEMAPWDCSDSDDYIGRHFAATNANGMRVTGVVCCGHLKSCTVRW